MNASKHKIKNKKKVYLERLIYTFFLSFKSVKKNFI